MAAADNLASVTLNWAEKARPSWMHGAHTDATRRYG